MRLPTCRTTRSRAGNCCARHLRRWAPGITGCGTNWGSDHAVGAGLPALAAESQIAETKNPGLSTRVFAIGSKSAKGFLCASRRSVGLEADMAQRTGLEPATPGVTGRYSNRLNYRCVSLDRLSVNPQQSRKICSFSLRC